MTKEQLRTNALEYVSFHVDDCLSPDSFVPDEKTKLVGYQCGFEPLVVAVRSGYGWKIDDEEAEELARDLLIENKWFSGEPKDADFIY